MLYAWQLRVILAATVILSAASERTEAQNFVERSAQCVAQIKRLNPNTHIRAGLTENKCPLATPQQLYDGAAQNQWIASGTACESDLGEIPDCGLASNFVDTLPGAIRRINLGNGRCMHVLPVMLTDKTEAFKCNAVKARPACVSGVRQDGETTVVTLATGPEQNASTADIVIPSNPQHHLPLFAKSRGGPLMTLLPADVSIRNKQLDSQGFLGHYINLTLSECHSSAAYCRDQASAQADRAVGELIRRVWNPNKLLSKPERELDYNSLLDRILASDLGTNSKEKKLYTRVIMKNEVSGASPYQLLDAVIRNSSISWGAHQIDLGANDTSEVDLFWNTLRKWRQAPGTGNYPALREADLLRQCLSQPGRAYFVDQIAIYLRALPDMNKAMRSDMGKSAYDARFNAYIKEEIGPALALNGLFKRSTFAWLYYVDQRNQRGGSVGQKLKAIGQALAHDSVSTCADIDAGEDSLVEYIKGLTAAGEHGDIDRRVKNIQDMLRQEFGPNLGRACDG